jgi:hypothetical protein
MSLQFLRSLAQLSESNHVVAAHDYSDSTDSKSNCVADSADEEHKDNKKDDKESHESVHVGDEETVYSDISRSNVSISQASQLTSRTAISKLQSQDSSGGIDSDKYKYKKYRGKVTTTSQRTSYILHRGLLAKHFSSAVRLVHNNLLHSNYEQAASALLILLKAVKFNVKTPFQAMLTLLKRDNIIDPHQISRLYRKFIGLAHKPSTMIQLQIEFTCYLVSENHLKFAFDNLIECLQSRPYVNEPKLNSYCGMIGYLLCLQAKNELIAAWDHLHALRQAKPGSPHSVHSGSSSATSSRSNSIPSSPSSTIYSGRHSTNFTLLEAYYTQINDAQENIHRIAQKLTELRQQTVRKVDNAVRLQPNNSESLYFHCKIVIDIPLHAENLEHSSEFKQAYAQPHAADQSLAGHSQTSNSDGENDQDLGQKVELSRYLSPLIDKFDLRECFLRVSHFVRQNPAVAGGWQILLELLLSFSSRNNEKNKRKMQQSSRRLLVADPLNPLAWHTMLQLYQHREISAAEISKLVMRRLDMRAKDTKEWIVLYLALEDTADYAQKLVIALHNEEVTQNLQENLILERETDDYEAIQSEKEEIAGSKREEQLQLRTGLDRSAKKRKVKFEVEESGEEEKERRTAAAHSNSSSFGVRRTRTSSKKQRLSLYQINADPAQLSCSSNSNDIDGDVSIISNLHSVRCRPRIFPGLAGLYPELQGRLDWWKKSSQHFGGVNFVGIEPTEEIEQRAAEMLSEGNEAAVGTEEENYCFRRVCYFMIELLEPLLEVLYEIDKNKNNEQLKKKDRTIKRDSVEGEEEQQQQ